MHDDDAVRPAAAPPSVSGAIEPGEAIDAGLRRVAGAYVLSAVWWLEVHDDGDVAVHEARKALKRVRSLLRLAWGATDTDRFRAVNTPLAEAARRLAPLREAWAILAGFNVLAADVQHLPSTRAVVEHLERLHDAAWERHGSAPEEVALQLQAICAEIDRWDDVPSDPDRLLLGIRRTYRRGRQRLADASTDPTAYALHEWRKRVKDLRHHAELVYHVFPPRLEELIPPLADLGEVLGEEHDLAELRAVIADLPHAASFHREIATVRAGLRVEAMERGSRLYAAPPARFAEWLVGPARAPSMIAPEAVVARRSNTDGGSVA